MGVGGTCRAVCSVPERSQCASRWWPLKFGGAVQGTAWPRPAGTWIVTPPAKDGSTPRAQIPLKSRRSL